MLGRNFFQLKLSHVLGVRGRQLQCRIRALELQHLYEWHIFLFTSHLMPQLPSQFQQQDGSYGFARLQVRQWHSESLSSRGTERLYIMSAGQVYGGDRWI